jgi:hypothetical protein
LKNFSATIEMINCFYSLLLLFCCITVNNLHMLNHSCSHGINPTWSWWMIFLVCCWIWFAIILLRILNQCSLRRLTCSPLFWMWHCPVLV